MVSRDGNGNRHSVSSGVNGNRNNIATESEEEQE